MIKARRNKKPHTAEICIIVPIYISLIISDYNHNNPFFVAFIHRIHEIPTSDFYERDNTQLKQSVSKKNPFFPRHRTASLFVCYNAWRFAVSILWFLVSVCVCCDILGWLSLPWQCRMQCEKPLLVLVFFVWLLNFMQWFFFFPRKCRIRSEPINVVDDEGKRVWIVLLH